MLTEQIETLRKQASDMRVQNARIASQVCHFQRDSLSQNYHAIVATRSPLFGA